MPSGQYFTGELFYLLPIELKYAIVNTMDL